MYDKLCLKTSKCITGHMRKKNKTADLMKEKHAFLTHLKSELKMSLFITDNKVEKHAAIT